jgi:hypothetical protein
MLRLSTVLGGTIDSKLSVVFAMSAHDVGDDVGVRSLSAAA